MWKIGIPLAGISLSSPSVHDCQFPLYKSERKSHAKCVILLRYNVGFLRVFQFPLSSHKPGVLATLDCPYV